MFKFLSFFVAFLFMTSPVMAQENTTVLKDTTLQFQITVPTDWEVQTNVDDFAVMGVYGPHSLSLWVYFERTSDFAATTSLVQYVKSKVARMIKKGSKIISQDTPAEKTAKVTSIHVFSSDVSEDSGKLWINSDVYIKSSAGFLNLSIACKPSDSETYKTQIKEVLDSFQVLKK